MLILFCHTIVVPQNSYHLSELNHQVLCQNSRNVSVLKAIHNFVCEHIPKCGHYSLYIFGKTLFHKYYDFLGLNCCAVAKSLLLCVCSKLKPMCSTKNRTTKMKRKIKQNYVLLILCLAW